MAVGERGQGSLEIGEGLYAIDLAGLCRTPNYAEW